MPKVKIAPECQRWIKECEFPTEDGRKREIEAMIRVCKEVLRLLGDGALNVPGRFDDLDRAWVRLERVSAGVKS
jgi:hypothetical protein